MDQKKESELPPLSETLVEPVPNDREATTLELDELWSFVLKKAHKRWIWIALSRRTRQVVAYAIGDRSQATCEKLWEAMRESYRAAHCDSDFWKAYAAVIPADQHTAVGIRSGQTAHVERLNNTLRQRAGTLGQADVIILKVSGNARSMSAFVFSSVQSCACCHL